MKTMQVFLAVLVSAMILLGAAGATAQGSGGEQFVKVTVGDITAMKPLSGTMTVTLANQTHSLPIQAQSGQPIQFSAQFSLATGPWQVTLSGANSTLLSLSGVLASNGSDYFTGYSKSSTFNSAYVSLLPKGATVEFTVGYTKGSIGVKAYSTDKSLYQVSIMIQNPTGNKSLQSFSYSPAGPSLNVTTPMIEMGLMSNVVVSIANQGRIVAHMNRTYDMVTGVGLTGVKAIDDPTKITSFNPILTIAPFVGVIALNNTALVSQIQSATPTAQPGFRVIDSLTVEQTSKSSNSTTSSVNSTSEAQQSGIPSGMQLIGFLRTSVDRLAAVLGTNANWLWLGIAAGLTVLIVAAVVRIAFT